MIAGDRKIKRTKRKQSLKATTGPLGDNDYYGKGLAKSECIRGLVQQAVVNCRRRQVATAGDILNEHVARQC